MKSFSLYLDARAGRMALCLIGVLGFFSACSKQTGPASGVLAKVGSREIRIEDLRKEVERRRNIHRPVPDKETLLQEMVDFEAMLQRARKAGLEGDPQLQREMNNLLVGKFMERELTPRLAAVKVTAEEVKAEYEKNIAKYTKSAQIRLAILHLGADSKTSGTKRAELRGRLTEARATALENLTRTDLRQASPDFGTLAIDYSEDQASRYRGGDIGWLEGGKFSYRWPRKVLEAGYALEKGHVGEVMEAEGGFYLAMKTDGRAGSITPLGQIEASIRHHLLVKKQHEFEEAFRQETARLAAVTIDRKTLAAVNLPPAEPTVAQNREAGPPALPGGHNSPNRN